jgi:hypothetical protein
MVPQCNRMLKYNDILCFLEANVNNRGDGSIVTSEWLAFFHIRNVPGLNPNKFS